MSKKYRHHDLTVDAVAAELPWRAELRGAGAEQLAYAIEIVGKCTRAALASINNSHDADAVVPRLRALVRACDALLKDFDIDDMSGSVEAGIAGASSPDPRGSALLRTIAAMSGDIAEIADLAKRLRERSGRLAERLRRDHRVDYERRALIGYAADMWETLTGRSPGKSKSGPFVRFCACAWIECGMPDLGEDPATALGPSIQTALELPGEKAGVAR